MSMIVTLGDIYGRQGDSGLGGGVRVLGGTHFRAIHEGSSPHISPERLAVLQFSICFNELWVDFLIFPINNGGLPPGR